MEYRFEQTQKVDRQTVKIAAEELKKVNNFVYIDAVVKENERYDYGNRASAEGNCETCSGMLCNIIMPVKLEEDTH